MRTYLIFAHLKCQARILELSINLFLLPGISEIERAVWNREKRRAWESQIQTVFYCCFEKYTHSLAYFPSHPLFCFFPSAAPMTRELSHANPNHAKDMKITSLLKNNANRRKNSSPDAKKQRSALLHLWDGKHKMECLSCSRQIVRRFTTNAGYELLLLLEFSDFIIPKVNNFQFHYFEKIF